MDRKEHGGVREGAGRKPADNATGVKRYNVMLDDETIKKAKKLGKGNLSVGIRLKFNDGGKRNESPTI